MQLKEKVKERSPKRKQTKNIELSHSHSYSRQQDWEKGTNKPEKKVREK